MWKKSYSQNTPQYGFFLCRRHAFIFPRKTRAHNLLSMKLIVARIIIFLNTTIIYIKLCIYVFDI